MDKDDYIMHLEILVEDLLGEIKSLSDDYGFSIHGGDCNYNYIKNEYELLKIDKEIIRLKSKLKQKEIKWK